MRLEEIGFYTLSDKRAEEVSSVTDLQRCELILTSRCNFKCPYCRGMNDEDKGDVSLDEGKRIIDLWASHDLQNIRFSGGEPTVYPHLVELVEHAKAKGIKRIALSTNGSAPTKFYSRLFVAGVNDFSISLDSCCAATGNEMAGNKVFNHVVENIKYVSKLTYTTVGVVLTEKNLHEVNEIIKFASSLGVADIRVIPAAQMCKKWQDVKINKSLLDKHPILKYRFKNFTEGKQVRGLTEKDTSQCPLVLDDMAVLNGKHYPCIIYMRERGEAIGNMTGCMSEIRYKRFEWFQQHNCKADRICKNNCLDVCIDHNNKVMRKQKGENQNGHVTKRKSDTINRRHQQHVGLYCK